MPPKDQNLKRQTAICERKINSKKEQMKNKLGLPSEIYIDMVY